MKILNAEQIKNWDQYTIDHEPISSLALMERAAGKAAAWIISRIKNNRKILIFCGKGNNGGDGFVIARKLYEKGFDVQVFVSSFDQQFSPDAAENYKTIKALSGIGIDTFENFETDSNDEDAIIIDAIFGTGLTRPVEGAEKELIEKLNKIVATKISIDIPSGLFADGMSVHLATVFRADYTLTFQQYKRSFLYPETGIYCGQVEILDIGLDSKFLEQLASHEFIITDEVVRNIYEPRSPFSHKGSHGRCCIVGGSYGMAGAAVLASKASAKTGSGITVVQSAACNRDILQISCPEAIFVSAGENTIIEIESVDDAVFAIGSGIGTEKETQNALHRFLKKADAPIILDADALNIIAQNPEWIQSIPHNSIITPHPKEFDRLFGISANSYERAKMASKKAKALNIYIILKGHRTQVFTPEGNCWFNITGNTGMAKGGSGDVLTGIIGSLAAQGYSSLDACVLGVWLHGKAGDFAVCEQFAQEVILPQDLMDQLGKCFNDLRRSDF